jgi:hypothetical protein
VFGHCSRNARVLRPFFHVIELMNPLYFLVNGDLFNFQGKRMSAFRNEVTEGTREYFEIFKAVTGYLLIF